MRDLFAEWERLDDASAFEYEKVYTDDLRRMEGIAKRACLQAYSTGNNRLRFLKERKRSGLDAIQAELARRGEA